jgi:hypothetical protein
MGGAAGQVARTGTVVRGNLGGTFLMANVGMSESVHLNIVAWQTSHSTEPLSRAGVLAINA